MVAGASAQRATSISMMGDSLYLGCSGMLPMIERSMMNEKIGRLMAQSKCPVCGSAKQCDVYVPRFGEGRNRIKWRCTNEDCVKSQWQIPTYKR